MKFLLKYKDRDKNRFVTRIYGHKHSITSLAYRRGLLVSADDQKIGLRNMSNPNEPRLIRRIKPGLEVSKVAILNNLLAVGLNSSRSGRIELRDLYNANNPKLLSSKEVDVIAGLAILPNYKIAFATNSSIGIRDPIRDELIERRLPKGDAPLSLSLPPNGGFLVSASRSGKIRLRNIEDLSLINSVDAHKVNVRDIKFSSDGNMLASASSDKRIGLRDISDIHNIRLITRIEGEKAIYSLDFSSNGHLLVAGNKEGYLCIIDIYDLKEPKVFKKFKESSGVSSVIFSDDVIIVGLKDGKIGIRDVATRYRPINRRRYRPFKTGIAISSRIIALSKSENKIVLRDVSNPRRPKFLKRLIYNHKIRTVTISQDEKLLVIGGSGGSIGIRDISNPRKPKQVLSLIVSAYGVARVAISQDNKFLAIATFDNRLIILDISNLSIPKRIKRIRAPYSHLPTRLVFSPDNKLAVIYDHGTYLIDVEELTKNGKSSRKFYKNPPDRALEQYSEGLYVKIFGDRAFIYLDYIDKPLAIIYARPDRLEYKLSGDNDRIVQSTYVVLNNSPPVIKFFYLEFTNYLPNKEYAEKDIEKLVKIFNKAPIAVIEEAARRGLLSQLVERLISSKMIEKKDDVYIVKPYAERLEGEVVEEKIDEKFLEREVSKMAASIVKMINSLPAKYRKQLLDKLLVEIGERLKL